MLIENFKIEELDQLASLLRSVFTNEPTHNEPKQLIKQAYFNKAGIYTIKNELKKIIAAVITTFDGHRGWVYSLAVHEDYRFNNLGSQLILHSISELKKKGCSKVNLQIRSDNKSVLNFYQKLGFKIEERISMGKMINN